jgi:hypothetical protein
MFFRPTCARLVGAPLAIGLLTWGLDAGATNYSTTGTFAVYAAGTSDSGWGYCTDREYNSSKGRYDLYSEPCAAPTNRQKGWNPSATQTFRVESNGLIEVWSANEATRLGCVDLYGNIVSAHNEIDIDPPGGQWGCVASNGAQSWAFVDGAIQLAENSNYCIQENGSGNPMTLELCTGAYNQVFVPINMSVEFISKQHASNGDLVSLDFINDSGSCEGGGYYGLFASHWNSLTNQNMFQFQPSNQPYFHALLAGQQDVTGAPVAYPVGLTTCETECSYPPYAKYQFQPSGGADTCYAGPLLGNAFDANGVTHPAFAYQYTGAMIENATGMGSPIPLPQCVTAATTDEDEVFNTSCTSSPTTAQSWYMYLANFPI